MYNKKCSTCNTTKPSSEYYKNKKSYDGLFSQCKECKKEYQRKMWHKKKKDPDWAEKERERHRAKYHRLNYKEKYKSTPEQRRGADKRYKERFPEKERARKASSHIVGKEGNQWHHWNYANGFEKDLILMTKGNHNKAHRIMVYDQDEMLYRDNKGNLLDTKERHMHYLLKNGVRIIREESF